MAKQLTLEHLKSHPEKLKQFNTVRIWSGEWQAYWRAKGCGYTDDISQAGLYDIEDAYERVRHCGREKKIKLINAT